MKAYYYSESDVKPTNECHFLIKQDGRMVPDMTTPVHVAYELFQPTKGIRDEESCYPGTSFIKYGSFPLIGRDSDLVNGKIILRH